MQRNYLIVAVMLVFCTLSHAQVGAVDPDRATGPIPEVRHPTLTDFSMKERAAIYDAVVKKNSASTAAPFDFEIKVGTVLPENIQITRIPESVLTEIPAAKSYASVVWGDQVLLVNPKTRVVADILRGYILRDQSH